MRIALGLGIYALYISSVEGQDADATTSEQPLRVIGQVADGSPGLPNVPKVLPAAEILSTKVVQDKGRKITMRKIVPPMLPAPPQPRMLSEEELAAIERFRNSEQFRRSQEAEQVSEFCFVSATVYDGQATQVMWWHKNEPFVAWSNLDWNVMGGFHQFEGKGQRFSFIMGAGATSSRARQLREPDFRLPDLPNLTVEGPSYVLVSGDKEDEVAIKFIDVLHDLYEAEGPRLIAARVTRDQNREKAEAKLKANPPKPKDTVIQYWRRPRETQNEMTGGDR